MKNTKYDSAPSHTFTSFPETHSNPNDNEDLEKLLDDPDMTGETTNEKQYGYSSIEFYQKYFNVSTNDVIYRIIGSMTPTFNQSFLVNRIRPNPDLYGPFWISISLIFTIAIAGNIVSFMHNFGSKYDWHTDFHKVTSSAATILIYWWLMPTILYVILRWRKATTEFTFIEILCIYGYSLSIYVPISVLWLINIPALQWILVLAAIVLSGSVLVFTFWPSFSTDTNKKVALFVMAMVLVMHALLGISFMLYFFHYPANTVPTPLNTTATTTTILSKLASAAKKV